METTVSRPTLPPRQVLPKPAAPTVSRVTFSGVPAAAGRKIGIYGCGGLGKTSYAAHAPGPTVFFDLDASLPILRAAGKLADVDIQVVPGVDSWAALTGMLAAEGWEGVQTIVIDSVTRAEEMAVAHTLETVPHEKGGKVSHLEGYGFGKGFTHVYETFLPLFAVLDRHVVAGRNVILICHDCIEKVPNPVGEDYIRWEPRLQSPSSGKASIRLRMKEWLDDLWFVGYDINVQHDKKERFAKAEGGGSRTLYPNEMPHCMAKSRTFSHPMELKENDTSIWQAYFNPSLATEIGKAQEA